MLERLSEEWLSLMSMSSYSVYKCDCGCYLDAEHVLMLSLKIHCPECEDLMVHSSQIDIPALREYSHE